MIYFRKYTFVFLCFLISNLVSNCKRGATGQPGIDGIDGSAGTTVLKMNIIQVSASSAATPAVKGPFCSAIWYNSGLQSAIMAKNITDHPTTTASIGTHQTTATCVYTFATAYFINGLLCFKQVVFENVLEGKIMEPEGAVGCYNSANLFATCTFNCWNQDGSGSISISFTTT